MDDAPLSGREASEIVPPHGLDTPGAGSTGQEQELSTLTGVYDDLRRIARGRLSRGVEVTIGATDLVHEVVTKMLKPGEDPPRLERAHLLALASTAMRSVIVDRARARNAVKRGHRALLDVEVVEGVAGALQDDEDALFVDEVLAELAEVDARAAKVVELLFFGGLNQDEVAEHLGVSERTVRRDWRFARAWLLRREGGEG